MRRVIGLSALGVAWIIASCSSSSSSSAPAADGGAPDAQAADGGGAADAGNPFQAVSDELFAGSWHTEGFVVLYKGAIVYEEYAPGWTKDMPHITYSISKSIGGTLVGLAIDDGLMKLTDSACTFIANPPPSLCETTVEHLLHMSSGLTWIEDYGTDPTTSDVLQMLYGNESDMGAFAANHARAVPSNSKWQYSSGNANILADVWKGALAAKGLDARTYAQTKLFTPLGITTSIFEADRAGTLEFSSSWYATPRDAAKVGQLYLDDGMVGATRVLPASWVKYATTPAPAAVTSTILNVGDPKQANPGDTGGSYGATIWLNGPTPTSPTSTLQFPGAPADAYAFEGHYGQKVFMIPSRKLVIARFGNDRTPTFDPSPMVQKTVAVIDAMIAGGK